MGLTECPDCHKQVSTEALACPACARPIKASVFARSSSSTGSRQADAGGGDKAAPVIVKTATSRGLFIVLGLFLGCLGIHNFYAGYYGRGAAQLIITLLLGWVIVGFVITAIWALFEVCTVKIDAHGAAMS